MKARKTASIRVRMDPIRKLALEKIAATEELDLSDIVRRALSEFLDRHSKNAKGQTPKHP